MNGTHKLRFAFALMIMALYLSCGIESYRYIPPVTNVKTTMNNLAVMRLPSNDGITIDFTTGKIPRLTIENQTKTFGTDYEIYYRIYLSGEIVSTVNTDDTRKSVNTTLASDWTAMEPYTVDSNNLSSSVASLFSTRKYYSLQLNSSGNLMRSNGNGAFNPVPTDRQFTVTEDLLNAANITANINADITGMASGTPLYAYTSMYIVMRSFDPQTLTPVYSSPTFINIFLLPSNIPVISVTGVSVTPSSASGPAVKLTAAVTPGNATNTDIVWSLSDETIAGLRDVGGNAVIVYSKGTGGAVTVTAMTVDGGHTASSNVTLSGIPATGIAIDRPNVTLSTGGTASLTATIEPVNANQTVTWVSSDINIASISSTSGRTIEITARATGTAIITAMTNDGTELSAACTVTVDQ
ncbi:MAG: Ig-like domain-containing protein [Spirochaetaceae bacterium]|nr:Ig-like domain-containing protein [Spirochaetaceae bacterium]